MAEGEVTGPGTDVPLAGRYRLLSVLGRGGMGTVWRATDETLDREVAIKEIRLHPSLTDEERSTAYARMMREARASARLGHPGVVTVHDVVVHDERPWLVMELVPARSLQDVMDDDGPQPPQRVAALGRQLAAALRAAHAVGILHRDVKPANVLVTDEGRAVLTDFGIAQLSGDATLTRTGMVMGSPAYMAPERVKGEAAGPASDVWALGATLYAVVEGQAPHHRSDAMAVLAAIMTLDAPPPRRAGALAPMLTAMLDREPGRRPNIDQVEQELGRVAAGGGPAAPRGGQAPAPAAQASVPAAWNEQVPREASVPAAWNEQVPREAAAPAAWSEQATHASAPGGWSEQAQVPGPPVWAPEPATRQVAAPGGGTHQVGAADGGTQRVEARPGGKKGGASGPVALGLVGLLALAVIGGVGYYSFGRSKDEPSVTSPSKAGDTTNPPKSHSPAPVKPRPYNQPPGTTMQNVGGLRLAVPSRWRRQDAKTFIDPTTSSYVQVDDRFWAGTPEAHWRTWTRDPNTAKALNGFSQISLVPATARNDQPASDLEFTWVRNSEVSHALDRGFRKAGQPYAVIVVAPERRWEAMRPVLRQVLDSAG
ncbi:serine/threonine-protein kinase [Actinomadura harenae]|uniref:non-specific serine/threonine protein kinase n=1 Tax=Actinomadura harenae TaxID=2483351 RepID=A0A3M2LRM9_9ACTN|nr:serine/threonine-protein kinase [Actinomadura harenae]RMI40057.1 serine/threonine protein kinase [Actinomadura harenae]